MTKKYNKGGSMNQNAPDRHGEKPISGDNSKGNKRNIKRQVDKTAE
ncbi:hypothetical protein [Bacillus kwashiorkori]|nr:hypothetical protein [Bacillus kwashiorkori]